jgi:Acetyltransferase (GNAT) domain
MRLEQLRQSDSSEIIDFLRSTFHADGDERFLAPAMIQWKYFMPRPDWIGSRSYVYRDGGRIVAHGGVVPITLPLVGGTLRLISVMDWAAAPSIRGVGRSLIADLTALVDARLAFGGSPMGRALLHRSKLSDPFSSCRRGFLIIRPSWAPISSATNVVASALRWARDSARLAMLPLVGHDEWYASVVSCFDDTLPDAASTNQRSDFALPLRTPALLNYMLACPGARVRGYLLTWRGRPRGHLLLFGVNNQVRVGDLQIDSVLDNDWRACHALAVRVARKDFPEAWSASADAFAPAIEQALRRTGYRLGPSGQCRAQDPGGRLSTSQLPALSMIDSDAAWL